MKILLANDTAIVPHYGCKAVSDGHARLLGKSGHEVSSRLFLGSLNAHDGGSDTEIVDAMQRDEALLAQVVAADAVVVNGEGTIHHGAGRPLLGLLEVAQRLGKATLLVNAVVQETVGFENTISRLDDFTVRERRSWQHAHDRGLRARIVPDSFLAAKFTAGPETLVGDVVTDWHPHCSDAGVALKRYLEAYGGTFLPLRSEKALSGWASLPHDLAGVRVVLTGRHHGVYAAIVAGRPFVAMPSNTHKIEGTLEDLALRHLIVTRYDDLVLQRDWALRHESLFRGLAEQLTDGGSLTTFRCLGIDGPNREEAEICRLTDDLHRHISSLSGPPSRG